MKSKHYPLTNANIELLLYMLMALYETASDTSIKRTSKSLYSLLAKEKYTKPFET